jgi:hypothetical protein
MLGNRKPKIMSLAEKWDRNAPVVRTPLEGPVDPIGETPLRRSDVSSAITLECGRWVD